MVENVGAKTVVLVHGGFVDGSGWEGVYNILRKDGYTVAVVQNPTISLADDVAATKRVIDAPRRTFIRWSSNHRGRQRSESRGARLYHRVCAGPR